MKSLRLKDQKKRLYYKKYEIFRLVLLYLIQSNQMPIDKKIQIFQIISRFPKKSSLTQIKNRCVLTNRSKSVIRTFQLSRIKIRELISQGLIPGYSKAVW